MRNLDSLKQGLLGDGTEHLSMEEQMALNVKLPDNMLPLRISKNGLTKGTRGQIQKFNIERLQNIMGNQSFQANPFDAMKVHLTNVVAIQNLQSKANEKKNKDHK